MNVKKSNLHKIIFVQNAQYLESSTPEVREAEKEFEEIGLKMEIRSLDQIVENASFVKEGTLLLSDDPSDYRSISDAGYYVVAWQHAGNEKVSFSKVPFLVSEPHWIDRDSYEKIYERLAGIPWTIAVTKRCIIREMTTDDTDAMYRIYDDVAREYMPGPKEDHEEERQFLASYIEKVYGLYGYGYWAVAFQDEPERMIGRVGFEPYQGASRDVSFGYLIQSEYRRQGLAYEVCVAALEFAEQNLDFPGIRAVCDRNNLASIELLGKLGFIEAPEQSDPDFLTFTAKEREVR